VSVLDRRAFLAAGGLAWVGSRLAWSAEKFVAHLDHLLLGCSDLDAGIRFVEQRTGVRPAIGGVHPGRGTRNALLSLGERQYLEVIAPDPQQTKIEAFAADLLGRLKALSTPRLLQWAAHVDHIDAFARRLTSRGLKLDGPHPGSRERPDGRTLHWKTVDVQDDLGGLVPFFIEWSKDSVHPSVDAPHGCNLESFAVEDKDARAVSELFRQLELDATVKRGAGPRLRAQVRGPRGVVEFNS
jgi:Glyoxalase-like domain